VSTPLSPLLRFLSTGSFLPVGILVPFILLLDGTGIFALDLLKLTQTVILLQGFLQGVVGILQIPLLLLHLFLGSDEDSLIAIVAVASSSLRGRR